MIRPRAFLAVAGGAVLVAVAGCGSDSSSNEAGGSKNGHSSAANTPSTGPSRPADNYQHQPGQAGKVQQTLTAAGFECTRHSDTSIDLRLCSKGLRQPDRGQLGGPSLVGGMLRYVSAPDGTVLFARLAATGDDSADEWKTMRLQMLKAVVPANDAEVLAADGDTITWGTYIRDPQNVSSDGWLETKGYDPSTLSVSGESLPITKEQALPKMKAAKFNCRFGDPVSGQDSDNLLTCIDPTFDDSTGDGVIADVQLTDTGAGISDIEVHARHGDIREELPAVREVTPKLSALGDTKVVPAIQDWAQKHLDGVPHAAYIGDRLAQTVISDSEITGSEVDLYAGLEDPALGYDPSKTGN